MLVLSPILQANGSKNEKAEKAHLYEPNSFSYEMRKFDNFTRDAHSEVSASKNLRRGQKRIFRQLRRKENFI